MLKKLAYVRRLSIKKVHICMDVVPQQATYISLFIEKINKIDSLKGQGELVWHQKVTIFP
jgi:hypothetical protein